jgi:hypothetical protein
MPVACGIFSGLSGKYVRTLDTPKLFHTFRFCSFPYINNIFITMVRIT